MTIETCTSSSKRLADTWNWGEQPDRESLERTLERMLEEWYEKTVSNLSPSEAVKELERILEVTCPTSVCEMLGLVYNTGTTGGEFILSRDLF